MATIKFYNNCFEDEFKEVDFDKTKTLEQQIVENIDEDEYKKYLVECYDPETDKTFYAPILDNNDDTSVVIMANDKIVNMDYQPQNNDVVTVVFMPLSENFGIKGFWGGLIGSVLGSLAGLAIGFYVSGGSLVGMVAGAITGGIIGLVLGVGVGHLIAANSKKQKYITKNTGEALPDVRGSENQSLLNNSYPFVIGKHLVNPFVVGDPITEYSKKGNPTKGEIINATEAYIKIMYCIGYAPLKITDLKLGDFLLARNGSDNGNILMTGMLTGCSGTDADNGDILNRWKNNDIKVEILQYNPNSSTINRGTIYPDKTVQDEINSNLFYIVDDKLKEQSSVVYKGINFPSRFRTNGVWFTDSYPSEFTIVLNAANGLYASYTETTSDNDESVSEQKYAKIPLWFAVQWRIYNKNNASSNSEGSDYDDWNTITTFNNTSCGNYYTEDNCNADIRAHKGNALSEITVSEVAGNWLGKWLCNLESFTGEQATGQIRLTTTVSLTTDQKKKILDVNNTTNSVEIRVIRISPNYMDETTSTTTEGTSEGAYSYSDIVTIDSITTKSFDVDYYRRTGIFKNVKVQSDELMKKFVYVAIKAKADTSGEILNQLQKFNCTAEAFAPVYDDTVHKWLPENVKRVTEYYGYYTDSTLKTMCNRTSTAYEVDLGSDDNAKKKYESARHQGYSWYSENKGSNFTDLMKAIIYPSDGSYHKKYHLFDSDWLPSVATQYNNATAASGFMLACVGNHCGGYALGYENINLLSLADCWLAQQSVEDGSTYSVDDGVHTIGDKAKIHFQANGYIYQNTKLEDLLSKLAIAGRSVYTYDDAGRLMMVMDKPVDYAMGVINQQNLISCSQSYAYDKLPAGFLISFSDENDGYEQNTLYCWSDGNSIDNYKGDIQDYSFDFVTNNYQAWSLGRYILGCKELNREIITAKVGTEGLSWKLGDVVVFQNEDLFIGEGSGRVQEVLRDDNNIYGFVMDSTYEFTGETETVDEKSVSTQGVEIFDTGKNKVSTYRLAVNRTQLVIGDTTYILEKGITNLVIFNDPVKTGTSQVTVNQNDIVMFGVYDKVSTKYRIIKKKPEKDFAYTFTLISYDEALFNYGRELPVFQSHITYKQTGIDGTTLSDVPTSVKDYNETTLDKIKYISDQNKIKITAIIKGTEENVGTPKDVTNLTAVARENYIQLDWIFTGTGLENTIDKFIIKLSKDNGETYSLSTSLQGSSYKWYLDYDETAKCYPTVDELKKWKFKVIVQNIYDKQSTGVEEDVNTDEYEEGWQPVAVTVSAIAEQNVIKLTINEGDNLKKYGTLNYVITPPTSYTNSSGTIVTITDTKTRLSGSGTEWLYDITGLYLDSKEVKTLKFKTSVTSNESAKTNESAEVTPTPITGYKEWTLKKSTSITAIASKDVIDITIDDKDNDANCGTRFYTVTTASTGYTVKGSGLKWTCDISKKYLSAIDIEKLTFNVTVGNEATTANVKSPVSKSSTATTITGYLGWTPGVAKDIKVTTRADGSGLNINWTDALNCCWGEHNHKVLVKYGDIERTTITTKDTNTKYLFDRSVDKFPSKTNIANYTVTVTTINAESKKSATATAVKAVAGFDYVGWDLSAPEIKVKATNDVASTKAKLTITNSVLNNDKFGLKKYEFTFTTSSTEETLKTKIASLSAVAVSEGVWEVDLTGKNLSKANLETVTVTCKVIGYIKDTSATSGIIETGETASGECLGSKFNYDEYYDYTPTVPTLSISVSGRTASINFSHEKFANFKEYQLQISKDKTTWYSLGSDDTQKNNEDIWKKTQSKYTSVSGKFYSIMLPLTGEMEKYASDTTYYFRARTASNADLTSGNCDAVTAIARATMASDIAQNNITAIQIATGAVETKKLAENAITTTKISDNAITTPKIVAKAVVADKIATNTIWGDKIAGNSLDVLGANLGQVRVDVISSHGEEDDKIEKNDDGTDKTDSSGNIIKHKVYTANRDDSKLYIDSTKDNEEFYIGNVGCTEFENNYSKSTGNSYEGLWFKRKIEEGESKTTFIIKVANFIVTSISSIIKGLFLVRDNKGNNLVIANPGESATSKDGDAGEVVPANTVKVNGDITATGTIKASGIIETEGKQVQKQCFSEIGLYNTIDKITYRYCLLASYSNTAVNSNTDIQYHFQFVITGVNSHTRMDCYLTFRFTTLGILNAVLYVNNADGDRDTDWLNILKVKYTYTVKAKTDTKNASMSIWIYADNAYNLITSYSEYYLIGQTSSVTDFGRYIDLNGDQWIYRTVSSSTASVTGVKTMDGESTVVNKWATTNMGLVNSNIGISITKVTFKTGDTPKQHITLKTLIDWMINQSYITTSTYLCKTFYGVWDYANNDILQLTIGDVKYELQLAGVFMEIIGSVTDYQTGLYRLRIHSNSMNNFVLTSGYTTFPVDHVAEYTCNGSSFNPSWRMLRASTDVVEVKYGGTGCAKATDAINNLINNGCTTQTTNPVDDDYYICQSANGGTTTTTYHRRKTSSLWNYIKSKIYTVQTEEETSATFDFDTYTTNGIYCPSGDLNKWGTVTWTHAPTETPPAGGFTLRVYKEGAYLRQYLTLYNNNDTYTRYYYYSGVSKSRVWSPWTTIRPIDSSGNFSVTTVSAIGKVMGVTISATGKVTATDEVSGNTVTATGTVSGGTVTATGTVSGGTVSATDTVSGKNVSATDTVSGATVIASSYLRIPIGHSSTTYTNGEIWLT